MKKLNINIKAIAIGTLVDIGGSILYGLIMGIAIGIFHALSNEGIEKLEEQLLSTPIMLISLIVGLIFVSVGGFVAGKIAKQNQVMNALCVGVVGIILGVFFSSAYPLWFNVSAFALTLPFAYLGGILSARNQPNKT